MAPETTSGLSTSGRSMEDSPARQQGDILPLSPQAQEASDKCIESYLKSLIDVSQALARQKGADSVSERDVYGAADNLGMKRPEVPRWPREIGAVLIGAGLADIGAVIIAKYYTFIGGLLIFLPIAIGLILYLVRPQPSRAKTPKRRGKSRGAQTRTPRG